MYAGLLCVVILSITVQTALNQIVNFQFTKPYKTWIEAQRTCQRSGGIILDVRAVYPNLFRFSKHIYWTNNFRAYTPWFHSRGCFQMPNITANKGFIVKRIEDCLSTCSNKYNHFGIQGNTCTCISIDIGSKQTDDVEKCYRNITESHDGLRRVKHFNYWMMYTILDTSFENVDDLTADFDDNTSKNCIVMDCHGNQSATYLQENCTRKYTGLCSNSETTDEPYTWEKAQKYCESIKTTLALQKTSLNDVQSGCENIDNSRRYWIGTLRTQIKHGLLNRDINRLNLYCQTVDTGGIYSWTSDCLNTKHHYMCGWERYYSKITTIVKTPIKNKTKGGNSSNQVKGDSEGTTTKEQINHTHNGGQSHFVLNFYGMITAITSGYLLLLLS